ncbi:MAG: hypothetical protein SOY04_02080, partial [Clostridium celatum]|nr:hypothetical protein [Clostridium celatum]
IHQINANDILNKKRRPCCHGLKQNILLLYRVILDNSCNGGACIIIIEQTFAFVNRDLSFYAEK